MAPRKRRGQHSVVNEPKPVRKLSIEDSPFKDQFSPSKRPSLTNESVYDKAKRQLQIGFIPKKIVCRAKEVREIKRFLFDALMSANNQNKAESSGTGGRCLYISGVPGTGKTSTLLQVLQQLKHHSDEDEDEQYPDFDFYHLNARKLTTPSRVMSSLWKIISNKKTTPAKATSELEHYFTSKGAPVVVVIDELDYLVSRKQKEIYTIIDWPSKPRSRLIFIGIANTLDLPERVLIPRVASRFGTLSISFSPYSREQLTQLIQSRLENTKVFDQDAIDYCSMKISSTLGDARRALNLCRQAIEVALNNNRSVVTTQDIKEASFHLTGSNIKVPILNCSEHEQLFLCAMVLELRRRNLENEVLIFKEICAIHVRYCKEYTKLKKPSTTELSFICHNLSEFHLIIATHAKEGVFQKVQLNGSVEDFLDALSNADITKPIITKQTFV